MFKGNQKCWGNRTLHAYAQRDSRCGPGGAKRLPGIDYLHVCPRS